MHVADVLATRRARRGRRDRRRRRSWSPRSSVTATTRRRAVRARCRDRLVLRRRAPPSRAASSTSCCSTRSATTPSSTSRSSPTAACRSPTRRRRSSSRAARASPSRCRTRSRASARSPRTCTRARVGWSPSAAQIFDGTVLRRRAGPPGHRALARRAVPGDACGASRSGPPRTAPRSQIAIANFGADRRARRSAVVIGRRRDARAAAVSIPTPSRSSRSTSPCGVPLGIVVRGHRQRAVDQDGRGPGRRRDARVVAAVVVDPGCRRHHSGRPRPARRWVIALADRASTPTRSSPCVNPGTEPLTAALLVCGAGRHATGPTSEPELRGRARCRRGSASWSTGPRDGRACSWSPPITRSSSALTIAR